VPNSRTAAFFFVILTRQQLFWKLFVFCILKPQTVCREIAELLLLSLRAVNGDMNDE
jgi:hypothetical protein